MSNQFNYELDERQIRLMMLNSESTYNDVAWQRFESTLGNSYKPMVKTALPKINFSISRSFVIPVLFIGLIGGLSITLFSFVDLKKKEEVIVEKPLLIAKPVAKPKPVAKKTIVKPKETVAPVVATPAVQTIAQNVKSEPIKTTESKVVIEPSFNTTKVTETTKKAESVTTQNTQVQAKSVEAKPKRKKKRIEVEELPTITAPANLTSSNEEPELDLK